MKFAPILLSLFACAALAQSVPNGTITPNLVWTPTQWNVAFTSKTDYPMNMIATGQRFSNSGAKIMRMNDRLFAGGATLNDGAFPPVSLDWLSTYEDSLGYTNFTLYGVSSFLTGALDPVAITAGAQTLNLNPGAAAIGVESFCVSNNANGDQCWSYYGEAHKRVSNANVYAAEFDVHTGFTAGAATPYHQTDTVGIQDADGAGVGGVQFTGTVTGGSFNTINVNTILLQQLGYQIAVGANLFCQGVPITAKITALGTGTGGIGSYTFSPAAASTIASETCSISSDYAAGAAMQVQNNIVPWTTGIVFGANALQGTDGVSGGTGEAIGLAQYHAIQWFNPLSQLTGQLQSTVTTAANGTKLTFTDSGLQISDIGGGSLAYFFPVSGTVANYLTFTAGVSGTSPIVAAAGSDAAVNLKLTAKGIGAVVSTSVFNALSGINNSGSMVSNGTIFTFASGTGTCATTSTLVGGGIAGSLKCTTAGTAASTITLTLPPVTNGYANCGGRDVTTPAVGTQTGAISISSVTISYTSVTQNDIVQFGCSIAY